VTSIFDPKINGFPGLMVSHVNVKFGDPSCIGFCDIVEKQTDEQMHKTTGHVNAVAHSTHASAVILGK